MQTQQITVTLPTDVLEIARARVASGAAASESDAIAEALLDSVLPPYQGPSEAFLEECARRYDHARANPSTLLTLDEAFEGSFLSSTVSTAHKASAASVPMSTSVLNDSTQRTS